MALSVEIAEFMSLIAGFWMLLPLMIRKVFLSALTIIVVIRIFKMVRSASGDD
ncbi:MAG: hypothetical protein IKU20_08870 [Lachnospiraceae bacterium]|nr:hypothetical protein [Lachnospiraceae bacterium]